MKQLLSAAFLLIVSINVLNLLHCVRASPLLAKANKNCPIVANNCVCEDSNNGGSNIFCPNRQYHSIFIHYKAPQEMFLTCNPRGSDGKQQYSTDIIYQLKNLTVARVDLLQLKNCPMPSTSMSLLTQAMKLTGLKGLHIVYGRFDESDKVLVTRQFFGLENVTKLKIERSNFQRIETGAFEGLDE